VAQPECQDQGQRLQVVELAAFRHRPHDVEAELGNLDRLMFAGDAAASIDPVGGGVRGEVSSVRLKLE
jgi:hypothetical protein